MEDNKKRKRPLVTPVVNKNARRGKPVTKTLILSNIKKEEKVSNSLEKLFEDKKEESTREKDLKSNQEEITLEKYNEPITVPTDQWKQSFRKTDSRELVSLIQYSSVSHNALLRLTGSYSTKMLSNLKVNNKELSGIESRPTKVFYNQQFDIEQAIKTNMLSYVPYTFNYLSSLEKDTKKRMYIDNLFILNEKLFFRLYMYNNEVIEVECIVLTKENKITRDFKIKDTRNSLKIFITEEKNNEEMISTIQQELQQNFLFFVLDRTDRSATLQMYSNDGAVPFTVDNLRKLNKDKITRLKDDRQYDEVKAKYNKNK